VDARGRSQLEALRTPTRNEIGLRACGQKKLRKQHLEFAAMEYPNLVDKCVGERVRSQRIALHMSEESLAVAVGTTVQELRNWEAGTTRIGSKGLMDLTRFLDAPPAFFFPDEHAGGLRREARSKETPPSHSVGAETSVEVSRLVQAFAGIGDPRFREVFIKLAQTMARMEVGGELDS